jgi:hypothetical protein
MEQGTTREFCVDPLAPIITKSVGKYYKHIIF